MQTIRRALASPHAALAALLLLAAACLTLRLAFLSTPNDLVFDEHYYVNAARRMLGLPVTGGLYAGSEVGVDPNRSHPGLAKLAIVAGIKLFGNSTIAWRLPAALMGTAAIVGIYLLARTAGLGSWGALGAAGLGGADPMLFLNSRIGTLDIYAVTLMIFGVAAYLRKRPLLAGLLIGLASSAKLIGLFALGVAGIHELFTLAVAKRTSLRELGRRAASLATLTAVALATLLSFVYLYDRAFLPGRNPVRHVSQMLFNVTSGSSDPGLVALRQREGQGNVITVDGKRVGRSPDARPAEWLLNHWPINYYRSEAGDGKVTMDFKALINPAIILLAIPALGFCGYRAWRRQDPAAFLPVGWFVATFLPFLAADIAGIPRPGFLYYMLVVLPGIYVAVAMLFSERRLRALVPVLALAALGFFCFYYPYKTWAGV